MIYYETKFGNQKTSGEIEAIDLLELRDGEEITLTIDLEEIVEYHVIDAEGNVVREGSCPRRIVEAQAGDGEKVVSGRAPEQAAEDSHISYATKRKQSYPSFADQLDMIFHEGIDVWRERIQSVKDAYPKGSTYPSTEISKD